MIKNSTAEGIFIGLLRTILNNEKPNELPDGVTADDIYVIGTRQDMAPITFCALNSVSPKPASERWEEFRKRFLDDCMRSEIQMSEYRKLVEYLCGKGVRIIPLKGCAMKGLYPAPNLRVMSDVDLLYEGVSEEKLAELMEEAGYSTENLKSGNHDVFHKKPCMNIELHRKLMSDTSPYKPLFENMFDRAVPDEVIPNLYHLKPEDFYLHVIAHAAKHFQNSGLGIRPVGDIYVVNQSFRDTWDRANIDDRLKSVGLDKFEEKVRGVAYAFFGTEEKEISEDAINFFFRGSTYGNYGKVSWNYMGKGGKSHLGFLLSRTFLPYSSMKEIYPILGKWPILYPFSWIYRVFDVLLHRRHNLVAVATSKVTKEESEYAGRILAEYGLK